MLTREDKKRYQRAWIAQRRADWFAGKSCVECGSTENLCLHHVSRKNKLSHRIWSWAAERRNAEISKCAVLCEDCHRLHHLRCGDFNTSRGKTPTNTVLDVKTVGQIRYLAVAGFSHRRIAALIGCGRQTVDDVIAGRSWAWLRT